MIGTKVYIPICREYTVLGEEQKDDDDDDVDAGGSEYEESRKRQVSLQSETRFGLLL